jgi:hypothetical protein
VRKIGEDKWVDILGKNRHTAKLSLQAPRRRYAENTPKKCEDVMPLDFESEEGEAL